MPRLQQDREAWQQGFDAGAGDERTTCPYAAGTVESRSWRAGFTEGKASRKTNVASRAAMADHGATITQVKEILRACYTPRATRSDLVEAVSAALDVLCQVGNRP
jgi:hypothetical protein